MRSSEYYHKNTWDRQVQAHRAEPDQNAPRVYTVCHYTPSFGHIHAVVKPNCTILGQLLW